MSLLSQLGELVGRRIDQLPAFQELHARQERAAPYWMPASALARSSMSDEQALMALRARVGSDESALADAVEHSSHNRSDFVSDRQFRLLSALAEDGPVRPIDPALADLFRDEEELGRLPLAQAFRRLATLEPGLEQLDVDAGSPPGRDRGTPPQGQRNPEARAPDRQALVGIGARSGLPLLRSDISASLVNQYLAIRGGEIPGDLNTPYFEAPRKRSFSRSFGGPRRPHAQT